MPLAAIAAPPFLPWHRCEACCSLVEVGGSRSRRWETRLMERVLRGPSGVVRARCAPARARLDASLALA